LPVVAEHECCNLGRHPNAVTRAIIYDPPRGGIASSNSQELGADPVPFLVTEATVVGMFLLGAFPGLGISDSQALVDRVDQFLFNIGEFFDQHGEPFSMVTEVFPETREARKPVKIPRQIASHQSGESGASGEVFAALSIRCSSGASEK